MKLSIVIISYNKKDYILQAVNSCLNQTAFSRFECEIIIGDDGSNDGSISVINKLCEQNENIHAFLMDRTDGDLKHLIPSIRVSNVIRKGMKMSKGEFIQILSADDFFPDCGSMDTFIDFLDNNPKFDSCYSNYYHFWDNGIKETPKQLSSHRFSRTLLWAFEYHHISCFMFRRKVMNYLLDRMFDDTGLALSCFVSGKTKFFRNDYFAYRQVNSGITRESDSTELVFSELLLFQDVLNKGFYKFASFAKFYWCIRYIQRNKKSIDRTKYEKYIIESKSKQNDLISLFICDCNKSKRLKLRFLCFFSHLILYFIDKAYKLFA